jgi:hypothetical protein
VRGPREEEVKKARTSAGAAPPHPHSGSRKAGKKEFSISPLALALAPSPAPARQWECAGLAARVSASTPPASRGRSGARSGARPDSGSRGRGHEVVAAEAAGLRAAAPRAAGGPGPGPGPRPRPLHHGGGGAPRCCPGAWALHLPSASWVRVRERERAGWAGRSVASVEISRPAPCGGGGGATVPLLVFAAGRNSARSVFDGPVIVRRLVCESLEHGRHGDCVENYSVRISAQFHNTWLDTIGIPRCGGNCPLTFGLA